MKKNIAVIFGGDSSEYDVSVRSGKNIFDNIDREKYNPYAVKLKFNEWIVTSDNFAGCTISKDDFSFTHQEQKVKFDCAIITIHGTPGEDGKLQAYFELIGLPYTTCGFLTSALTFDKFTCNKFLNSFGVLTAKSIVLRNNKEINSAQIVEQVGLPCFVKPNNGGSSCGTSKVKQASELEEAIKKAFAEDNSVIIEQFIEGTELTCGVLKTNEKQIIFPLVEIVSKKEFFDYEAKYNASLSDEILPARVSAEHEMKCKSIASEIYDLLNCKGIVRMDFILNGNNFYFLEVNTTPGMTSESIVPKMVKAVGLSQKEFFSMLIENALESTFKRSLISN